MITEEPKESQFEEDLYIDPTALDVEWLNQPNTFLKYTEKLAWASRELDRHKQRLDVIQARVDTEVRGKYTDKKPTETAIHNEVIQNELVLHEMEEILHQKYEVDLLTGAVRAFDQRKTALENLVRLQGQNYFAVPKEPRNLGAEYEKKLKQDAARKRMAEASTSRRRDDKTR
jgi:hypothetical protein